MSSNQNNETQLGGRHHHSMRYYGLNPNFNFMPAGFPLAPVVPTVPTQVVGLQPQLNFYDPMSGRSVPLTTPFARSSLTYNDGRLNVTITGSQNDVNTVHATLARMMALRPAPAQQAPPAQVTQIFNAGNINVTVTGTQDNVARALQVLAGQPQLAQQVQQTNAQQYIEGSLNVTISGAPNHVAAAIQLLQQNAQVNQPINRI